jgi:hypothetical protein
MSKSAERLRGGLEGKQHGARGIVALTRNPGCQRQRVLIAAGIPPATVAREIYKEPAPEGQSPFAIQSGNSFEDHLFENGASELLMLLQSEKRLSRSENKVVNIAQMFGGTNRVSLLKRERMTRDKLKAKLAGDAGAPNIIVKPRLSISVAGVRYFIEPDVLIAADADTYYRVGEVKSYPDRDGKSDPGKMAQARRQAAVGALALREATERVRPGAGVTLVPPVVDLVLARRGYRQPALRSNETIVAEMESVAAAIDQAPRDLADVEKLLGTGVTLETAPAIETVPNRYRADCLDFCALAKICRKQAAAAGEPAILGNAYRELLPETSLGRAEQLLTGKGAPPRDATEQHLADAMRDALKEWRRAV